MKKIKFSIVAMLMLGAVACKKNDSGSTAITANVSNAEAADMVAGSLSSNSNGVANVATDATLDASVYVRAKLACGTAKADTISRQSQAGAQYTYNYKLTYNYMVNCVNNVLDNLSSNLAYSGSFSGPNLSSANAGRLYFHCCRFIANSNRFLL